MKREISEVMKYEICEDVVDALEKFGKDNVKKNLREMDDEDVRYLRVDFGNTIMDVFEYEMEETKQISYMAAKEQMSYAADRGMIHFMESLEMTSYMAVLATISCTGVQVMTNCSVRKVMMS